MLHAFLHNKSNAYKRYLDLRDPTEQRVSSEDEITSLVFGPLDYLSVSDKWKLWKTVLESRASTAVSGLLPTDYFSEFSPTACIIEFWPKRGHIEPDIVIRFSNDKGVDKILLIELKWNSGLSGADQLKKQWLSYSNSEHESLLHVFITKRMGLQSANLDLWSCSVNDKMVVCRLRSVRWHVFMHEIAKLAHSQDTSVPLKRWCDLTVGFFAKIGIRPFVGFLTTVKLADGISTGYNEPVNFWRRAESDLTIQYVGKAYEPRQKNSTKL